MREDPSVVYLGPRSFALAFACICALFVGLAAGADWLTARTDSAPTIASSAAADAVVAASQTTPPPAADTAHPAAAPPARVSAAPRRLARSVAAASDHPGSGVPDRPRAQLRAAVRPRVPTVPPIVARRAADVAQRVRIARPVATAPPAIRAGGPTAQRTVPHDIIVHAAPAGVPLGATVPAPAAPPAGDVVVRPATSGALAVRNRPSSLDRGRAAAR